MRQYVTWLERKFDACQSRRSIYLYILNSFLSYTVLKSMRKFKNHRFHVPQPTFLFPLETPLRLWP